MLQEDRKIEVSPRRQKIVKEIATPATRSVSYGQIKKINDYA
jgi:hypothetical protein